MRLNISQSKLARIESEKAKPHMGVMNNICRLFDVRPEWLLHEEGTIFNDGTNIYKDAKGLGITYDPNLLESLIICVDELMKGAHIGQKAKVINYYFEHYKDKEVNADLRKQEISSSIKFVTELLEEKS
jgi:transcriptional regulator with XRE-family HTH domain